jgi:hypothetical protein
MDRRWGTKSQQVYSELHPVLQYYLDKALQEVADISLVCGHRGQKEQNEAFDNGTSKVRWPDGKHNKIPSVAVDLQPYPMPTTEFKVAMGLGYIAGRIIQMAAEDGITIRWGGDWDKDGDVTDQNFDDLFHLELVELPSAEEMFNRIGVDIGTGVRS